MPKAYASQLSRGKKLSFSVVLLALLILLFDFTLYVALSKINNRFSIFYEVQPINLRDLRHFANLIYHPRYGWDIPCYENGEFGARREHAFPVREPIKMKFFGDSFTFAGVHPRLTFEYLIEEQAGWGCLNYGVLGYGPDQALLKFMDNEVASEYTVLGIMVENIGRVVNNVRGFYAIGELNKPKPRFRPAANGEMELIENPIGEVEELRHMLRVGYLDSLREYDYWSSYYQEIGMPKRLTWPASLLVARHAGFFVDNGIRLLKHKITPTYESYLWKTRYYHLYEEGSEGLQVLTYIVDEFMRICRERGETPIVLIFPTKENLALIREYGRWPYQSLLDHLRRRDCPTIDLAGLFLDEPNFRRLYDGSHPNLKGRKLIAQEIIRFVNSLEQRLSARQ